MKRALPGILALTLFLSLSASPPVSLSYPSNPTHGGRLCLDCHKANGPWQGNGLILTDILDARSGRSCRTGDNEFSLSFKPGEEKALVGIFGVHGITKDIPNRVGWAFLDDDLVRSGSLASSKLPTGWLLNKPYGSSYLDEKDAAYSEAHVARVSFAIQPGAGARNAEVTLHALVQGDRDPSGKQTAYDKSVVKLKVEPAEDGQSVSKTPAVGGKPADITKRGMEVFREKKCGACHKLNGVGGSTALELTHIGSERTRDQLEKYLRKPESVFPNTYVRPIELSEDKMAILLDLLESLK